MKTSTHKMTPGETMTFTNQTDGALILTLEMPDGTQARIALHPGADFELTAGKESAVVSIKKADGPQRLRPAQ